MEKESTTPIADAPSSEMSNVAKVEETQTATETKQTTQAITQTEVTAESDSIKTESTPTENLELNQKAAENFSQVMAALQGAISLPNKPIDLQKEDGLEIKTDVDRSESADTGLFSPISPTQESEKVPSLDEITSPTTNVPTSPTTNGTSPAAITNTASVVNDYSSVKANDLGPREQEKFDEEMMAAMDLFFNNKFTQAKTIFENKSKEDPLYSLGLATMSFIKAITFHDPADIDTALTQLNETYVFADSQINKLSPKTITDTVSIYITNLISTNIVSTNPTHMPTNTRPYSRFEASESEFSPNGALRAYVIKAESSLLTAILHLSMESMVGYLKAGLNLRRAYYSYSIVWQEYKRMGQSFNQYMDKNTISAIQFGIGLVHLLLSSLPPKILKVVSTFGWTADKHLGYALLKLCLEGKCIRSPLASLMLLSYYIILTSYAPQVLTRELIQPAIECLLEGQSQYPNSAFFLYFAGRVSRLARNIPLSTQSFAYTIEVTQGDWAEFAIGNLSTFEVAFNAAMALDWSNAALRLLELRQKYYDSPAFLTYFYGACMEMMGNRTEAILAFAEAPRLMDRKASESETFVRHRVRFFEVSGYQDLDFSLPALEVLFTWNAFPCMAPDVLELCLDLIDDTLRKIYERERLEHDIRNVELVPLQAPPNYYDQKGILLLMKTSILNALERFEEGIIHVNWLIDNKDKFKHTNWIVPFTYWESGNLCWGTEKYKRARSLWEQNLTLNSYDFEFRLSTRLNLAIQHAIELGVPETPLVKKSKKGKKSTQARTKINLIPSKSTEKVVSSKS